MVTNEGRNNIIALAYIGVFGVVMFAFFFTYVNQAEKATNMVTVEVRKGVDNVTDASTRQTNMIDNLTHSVDRLVVLTIEDREQSDKALKTFMGTFKNQSDAMVTAINEMSHDNNVTREVQTKAFIDAIEKQMNLTQYSQNLTEQRIQQENLTAETLDSLVQHFNLTLVPNATTVVSPTQ